MRLRLLSTASAIIMAVCGTSVCAQDQAAEAADAAVPLPFGSPVEFAEGVTFDPIIDARLRYEGVDQDSAAGDADAITARLRFGGQIASGRFSFLAEAEGTLAILDDYNDTIPRNGIEPFSVIADPENVELNRLQVAYSDEGFGATLGRQRIILDNSRFVGNVGWRQNEQTFDAVRGQAAIGPVSLDATYSNSQRTIFGVDSPNEAWDVDFVLLNGGMTAGPLSIKVFGYLLDYGAGERPDFFSSQTYGVLAIASIPLSDSFSLDLTGSYANQSDYGINSSDYDVDYINGEIGGELAGFGILAGYEKLGASNSAACDDNCAFQTPLATLHKFNGWADIFLTTPTNGLQDYYVSVGRSFSGVRLLPGLNASVTYHRFESDIGDLDYGDEWDANLGFKIGGIGFLLKYANYRSDGFAVDTKKYWLQAAIDF